jgi:hypothetical protein
LNRNWWLGTAAPLAWLRPGGEATSIFAESSPYDSYEHFSPGPFINIRDAQGNEMICRIGGVACVPPDDCASKLT